MILASQLDTLLASGLVQLAAAQPELEYLFRHALIQDAAYHSLVKADRKQLHRAVGEALETLYSDQAASRELAPLLAQHYDLAGEDGRALRYFILAADAAARVYANPEAALHYSRALEIARRVSSANPRSGAEQDASPGQIKHIYLNLGQALELDAQYAEATGRYVEMEALARERGDGEMEFAALLARAKILSTPNPVYDPGQARALLEQTLRMARAMGDRAAESKILWNLMVLDIFDGGDLRQAIAYGEQSLALARELEQREQLAFTLNDIHYAYMGLTEPAKGRAALEEAHRLWLELNNVPMLADSLSNKGIHHYMRGEYSQSVAVTEEAFRLSQSISNVFGQANSRFVVGNVYLELGQTARAIEIMEEAIRLGEQCGHPPALIITRSDLGWMHSVFGNCRLGLELATSALTSAETMYPLWRPHPLATVARIHLLAGDIPAAAAAVDQARACIKIDSIQLFGRAVLMLAEAELAIARHDHERALAIVEGLLAYLSQAVMRPFVPEALCLKGQVLLALGEAAAGESLRAARAEATALGSRRSLWPVLAALSEIEAQNGNRVEALSLRQQAHEILSYIADNIPTAELRASFLQTPRVRALTN